MKYKLPDDLEDFFKEKVESAHLPGLAVAIVDDQNTLYQKGFGKADMEQNLPVTPKTTFQIGSISKTFTIIAIMQQWELGKFKLDDDVNQYLPDERVGFVGGKRKNNHPVTFRHLMTHTAGIGEIKAYSDLLYLHKGLFFIQPKNKPLLPLEDRLKNGIPCYVEPGSKYSYANHGVSLLGYLLEQLSGESFHEYIRNHILDPLGMDRSDAYLSDRVKPTFAHPYKYKWGKFAEKRLIQIWGRPAGGIYSCIEDMVKYIRMLLRWGKIHDSEDEGSRIIKKDTLEIMYQNQFCLDPRLEQFGLVWHLYHLDGKKCLWHGGQTMGFNSSLHICPDANFGFIILANSSQNRPTYPISRQLLWKIFNVDVGKPPEESHPAASEASFLEKLTGYYGMVPGLLTNTRNLTSIGEFKVYIKNEKLYLKSLWGNLKGGTRLYPADPKDPYLFQLVEKVASHTIEPYENVLFRVDNEGKVSSFDYRLNTFLKRRKLSAMHNKLKLLPILISIVIIIIILISLFA